MKLIVHDDGGARGNPGPAAIAAVLSTPEGDVVADAKEAIGIASARTVTMGHISGRRVTIGPQAVPGGVAVMATLGSQ